MSLLVDDRFAALSQGDHVCAVYSDPAEQATAMVRYIRSGLQAGERCVYVTDDRSSSDIRERLSHEGVDVAAAVAGRSLLLLSKRESYLKDGEFSPATMVEFLRGAEHQALVDGRAGLRVTGEMTWALGPEVGCDRIIEYEVALNRFFPGSRSHAICQYNRIRFGASVIRDVLRTHPIAIIGQQICPNPYYEPPHLALAGSDSDDARVDWMVEQLVRFRASELRLQEAIAARDEFLTLASHELRTPLNALNLAVETLGRSTITDQHLERIKRQVDRLNRLLDSTFDVSRLRDPRRRLEPELCDLQKIVAEVVSRFELESIQSRSPISSDVPQILGYWDRRALDQILSNLMSNALKYGHGRSIEVSGEQDGDRAVLRVRDHGIGIPPEHRERIFERFARAVSTRSYSGFGLGLWIVRESAAAMGGSVTVSDAGGHGTLFEVSLPLGYGAHSRH